MVSGGISISYFQLDTVVGLVKDDFSLFHGLTLLVWLVVKEMLPL